MAPTYFLPVIPAQAGIQGRHRARAALDPGLRRGDGGAVRHWLRRLVDHGEPVAEPLGNGVAHEVVQPHHHVRQLERAQDGLGIAREKAVDVGAGQSDDQRLARMQLAEA